MEYKKLGFGTMRLPLMTHGSRNIDIEAFKKLVDAYIARGYSHFDTSYVYHQGNSEKALKEAVVNRYPRDTFTVTDKMPTFMIQSSADYQKIFDIQLERTGLDYFDYYWLHALSSPTVEASERLGGFEFLKQKKSEGKIKHIGFSFHDTAEILDIVLTNHPEVEYVQLIINYIDWTNGGIEIRKCYETVIKHQRQVFAMEPVKGGFLANVPDEVEKTFKEYTTNTSSASWAFRWAASLDLVFMVLSGMNTMEQLTDNMNTFDQFTPLNNEELKLIEKAQVIFNKKSPNSCIYCGVCQQACPKNLPIANYIGLYNNRTMFAADGWQSFIFTAVGDRYGRTNSCDGCKACEKVCPQNIKIAALLKNITSAF